MKAFKWLFCLALVFTIVNGDLQAQTRKKKNKKSDVIENRIPKEEGDVELVCFGEGATPEEATQAALRSGIEKTCGAFVSANTQIVNDESVRDEISTVASGNIKRYDELSKSQSDGMWKVSLNVLISKKNLVSYVQSHGGTTELAGETFAANYKMEQFYKANEAEAIRNMFSVISELEKNAFDYEITVGEPSEYYTWYEPGGFGFPGQTHRWRKSGYVFVPVTITCKVNDNIVLIRDFFDNTISVLSTSKTSPTGGERYSYCCKNGILSGPDPRMICQGKNFFLRGDYSKELQYHTVNRWRPDQQYTYYGKSYEYTIEDGIEHKYGHETWASKSISIEWKVNEYSSLLVKTETIIPGSIIYIMTGYLEYTVEEIEKVKTISIRSKQ